MSAGRLVALTLAAAMAGACAQRPAAPAPAPVPARPVAAPPLARVAGAVDYLVDPRRSSLRVLVYRAGPLAAQGHNHVLVNDAVAGWIRAGRALQDSAFQLQFVLQDFRVDPPQARAEEGPDFAAEVGDEARAGTRRNLFGAGQLDEQRYPVVVVDSLRVHPGAAGAATADVSIGIAGRTRTVSVPFTWDNVGGQLHVHADFPLRQTDLGLTPLSVLMGQLQVQDEMRVRLDVVAAGDQAVALE